MNLKSETLSRLARFNKSIADIDYCSIKHCLDYELEVQLLSGDFDLNALDIDYDNGYGMQHIHGFIVFTDGTWFSRHSFNGSECWDYLTKPAYPESL